MKKKVVIGIFIALAVIFLNFHSKINEETGLTLGSLTNKALAGGEANICDEIWIVEYSGSITVPPSYSVTCTTGGDYKCPICFWN